jgi:hypothetical protein
MLFVPTVQELLSGSVAALGGPWMHLMLSLAFMDWASRVIRANVDWWDARTRRDDRKRLSRPVGRRTRR